MKYVPKNDEKKNLVHKGLKKYLMNIRCSWRSAMNVGRGDNFHCLPVIFIHQQKFGKAEK